MTEAEHVLVPREAGEELVDRAVKFMLGVSLGGDYRWPDYFRDLYKIMIEGRVSASPAVGGRGAAQSQPVTDHAASAAGNDGPCDLDRYAALGRACEANGLAGYGTDIFHGGEAMWFQPPGDVIAEQAAAPFAGALQQAAMELNEAASIIDAHYPNAATIFVKAAERALEVVAAACGKPSTPPEATPCKSEGEGLFDLDWAVGKRFSASAGSRVRHLKRGTTYVLPFGKAEALLQTEEPLTDDAVLTIYIGEDGMIFARPSHEFHDGRFVSLFPAENGADARQGSGANTSEGNLPPEEH